MPARRFGGSSVLSDLQARGDVDAVVGGRLLVQRLLLRLHDVGQRGIARLVEAEVGRHHQRQLDLQHLEAAVDLAGDRGFAGTGLELRGEGGLRPAEEGCEHLAGLVAVVVDRLLAEDDDLRLFGLDHALQDLGDGERLDQRVGLDEDRPVGAHGERGAERFLRLLRPDRNGHDLGRLAGFLEAHGLLDADFVEGVHRHLHVGQFDTRTVGLHTDLDVVVNDPLHSDQDFHHFPRYGGLEKWPDPSDGNPSSQFQQRRLMAECDVSLRLQAASRGGGGWHR